jgi:hypothetical protein
VVYGIRSEVGDLFFIGVTAYVLLRVQVNEKRYTHRNVENAYDIYSDNDEMFVEKVTSDN